MEYGSFVAHHSKYHMRYRLKFGNAFAAQKNQICVTGENAAKFVAHNPTEGW